MLTRLREEACVLGAGFVAESRKYKKIQKRHIALESSKKKSIEEKLRKQRMEEEKKYNASYAGQLAIKNKLKLSVQLAKNKELEERRKGIFVEKVEEKQVDNNEIMKIQNNEEKDTKLAENVEDVAVIDENNTNINDNADDNKSPMEEEKEGGLITEEVGDTTGNNGGKEGIETKENTDVVNVKEEIVEIPVVTENDNSININNSINIDKVTSQVEVQDEITNIEIPIQEATSGVPLSLTNDDNTPSENKTANLDNTTEFQFEES
jgi:hypothetical protein